MNDSDARVQGRTDAVFLLEFLLVVFVGGSNQEPGESVALGASESCALYSSHSI